MTTRRRSEWRSASGAIRPRPFEPEGGRAFGGKLWVAAVKKLAAFCTILGQVLTEIVVLRPLRLGTCYLLNSIASP